MNYATNGKGNLGVTLGAIGTGLGVLGNNGGLLNGLFGGGCNHGYTKYDAEKDARIAELETEVKLRDANTFTMGEMGKLRDYVDHRFDKVENQLCAQAVHNATNDAVIGCIQGQVATLMGLTKTIVPAVNICPTPMPQFNSWVAPNAPTTGG
jgi:hypothetical protein